MDQQTSNAATAAAAAILPYSSSSSSSPSSSSTLPFPPQPPSALDPFRTSPRTSPFFSTAPTSQQQSQSLFATPLFQQSEHLHPLSDGTQSPSNIPNHNPTLSTPTTSLIQEFNSTTTSMVSSPIKTTGETLMCLVSASLTMVEHQSKVYAFGGFHQYTDEVYNDVYVLDLNTQKWSAVIYTKGVPPSKRTAHSASLWRSDRIIIFGGTTDEEQYLNDVIVLDLNTLTWERPEVSGSIPTGRLKHAATVHEDKLYIHGGSHAADNNDMSGAPAILDELNILDLNTWTWSEPITFVARHSHYACVHGNRFMVYGGLDEDMDRAKGLRFLNLTDPSASIVSVNSHVLHPHPSGQHFAQLSGDRLVVVVTQCLEHDTPDMSAGIWSLDLNSLVWSRHDDTQASPSLENGSWHYFALAEESSIFYLFGSNDRDSDEYLSAVLPIDLREQGLFRMPRPTLSTDFYNLLASPEFSDFRIQAGPEGADDGPPICAHRLILSTRWPHFHNLQSSGMTETQIGTLRIPEPRIVVLAFLYYIYSDNLGIPTGTDRPIHTILDPITISHLLVLSNIYILPRLSALCSAYLHSSLSVPCAARIFHAASLADDQGLKRRALRFMCRNFGPVSRTEGFRCLSGHALTEFLDCVPERAVIYDMAAMQEG